MCDNDRIDGAEPRVNAVIGSWVLSGLLDRLGRERGLSYAEFTELAAGAVAAVEREPYLFPTVRR